MNGLDQCFCDAGYKKGQVYTKNPQQEEPDARKSSTGSTDMTRRAIESQRAKATAFRSNIDNSLTDSKGTDTNNNPAAVAENSRGGGVHGHVSVDTLARTILPLFKTSCVNLSRLDPEALFPGVRSRKPHAPCMARAIFAAFSSLVLSVAVGGVTAPLRASSELVSTAISFVSYTDRKTRPRSTG